MYFAAACSFPGGLVVLIFISSTSQSCASRASAVVSPTSEEPSGIPIAGGFCCIWARNGTPPHPQMAIALRLKKLQRFQLTKAPSSRIAFCVD